MSDKGKKKGSDPTWDHCTRVMKNDSGRLKLKCNYCLNEYWGGVIRMKHHLAQTHKDVAPCKKSSDEVRDIFLKILNELKKKNCGDIDDEVECFEEKDAQVAKKGMYAFLKDKGKGKEKQITLNAMVKDREQVCLDICRFFYGHALPFHLVKSPLFHKMMNSVGNYGKGLKVPSYHEVRVSYLKKEVDNIHESLEKYKLEWKRNGCTLMSDGWSDGRGRSITNFLVNSPMGTVFLKSVDTSSIAKDSENLFKLLDALVEEIGEENVVQVVTDSASAYVSAGAKLMEKRKKLFWSPCAAHCIDLMLSDIGELPVHKDTISKARKITVYIYRHSWVLNLMRKYTKNRELARPGVTRFATSYITLKSILDQKIGLRAMFASEEWAKSSYAKKIDAMKVQEIVLGDIKFWQSIKFCLKSVLPLVKVLRLVDGDAKPAMGYIYEAMDRAKEQIEKNFNYVKTRYEAIWKIIDTRWDLQLHRPLHAAAYYFNPKFHYDPNFDPDMEVKLGLYKTIERMCPSIEERIKIDEQMDKFHKAEGMFGMSMAIITRDKKQPALWWESYGEGCKELQKLAIRVLSLTCSATGCERNWSTFDHVHSKKRNRLEQQRVNALVFVKYNINLELRHLKRQENGDSYDPICLSDMESDDEWITEKENPCLPEDNSWMDIHECFQVNEEECSGKRKRGPRNLNATKKSKKKVTDKEQEIEMNRLIDEDDEEEEDAINDEIMEEEDDDDLNIDLGDDV